MRPDTKDLDELMRDARVAGLKIVALLMALVTLGFVLARSVDAATPIQDTFAYCDEEWCMVKKKTLLQFMEGTQRLAQHVAELEKMCRWRD